MRLKLLDEAELEMALAAEHYEIQRPGLGEEFLAAISNVLDLLLANRYIGQPFTADDLVNMREYPIKRFPYYIVYKVSTNLLTVISIAHQRRRQRYWYNRVHESPAIYQLAA
jgi:plasmid stabilization system protein ParE